MESSWTNSELASAFVGLPAGTDIATLPIARQIIYTEDTPGRWADICCMAFRDAAEPDAAGVERQAALLIEIANGKRRLPGLWDVELVSSLLADARALATITRDTARKARLLELWAYHTALVAHAAGNYALAAEAHDTQADTAEAAGNTMGAANGRYMAAYERVQAAIVGVDVAALLEADGLVVVWNDPNVQKCFEDYRRQKDAYLGSLVPSKPEDLRWRYNVLCHFIRICWMVEGAYCPEIAGYHTELAGMGGDLRPAFADALYVLTAIRDFPIRDLTMVDQIVMWCTAMVERNPEWGLDGLDVVASCFAVMERQSRSREIYAQILGLKVLGGHLARAITRQTLAEWDQPNTPDPDSE